MQFIKHKIQLEINYFIHIPVVFMEEIKQLYERLSYASDTEREELWKIIIDKNRSLFKKRREELNKILKKT